MKSKRRLVGLSFLALMMALGCVGTGWWVYANQVPVIRTAAVPLPSPNGYDDYVAAAGLLGNGRSSRSWDLARMPADTRRSLLAQNREALERLREGLQYEFRNPPLNPLVPGNGDMTSFDTLGRLLVLEGRQAQSEGRVTEAVESYLDCLQMGVDLPKGGALIHGLSGLGIQERGLAGLQHIAPRLDERTALRTLRQMRELNRTAPTLADTLTAERDTGLIYFAQVLRSTNPMQVAALAGYTQNLGMAAEFYLTPKRRMLSNYQQYMTASIARAEKPVYNSAPAPALPKDFLCRYLAPATESAGRRWALRDAEWRLTEACLALRAYEVRHGAPPAKLEQLVPQYLPAVPADPFAPQPLLLRRQDGRAVVYSRGPDGDDDLGFQSTSKNPYRDGDLVTILFRR